MMLACRNKLCSKKQGISSQLLPQLDKRDTMAIKYTWTTRLICGKCNCIHYHCGYCEGNHNGFQVLLRSNLSNHHRQCHGKDNQILSNKDHLKNTFTNDRAYKKQRLKYGHHSNNTIKEKKMQSQAVSDNASKCSSIASSLIAIASSGISSARLLFYEKNAILQLLLAKFSSELTRYQRNDFCKILSLINKKYDHNKESKAIKSNMQLKLNLPTTDAEIRSTYLSKKSNIEKFANTNSEMHLEPFPCYDTFLYKRLFDIW